MKKISFQKFIRYFLILSALLLFAAAALVAVFDPFYHYHGPVFGLKAVVTKSEYQCIGTIRNFSYDSVLCGSSTAENYNNGWFDELFGARTVKAIKSSGTTADLRFYLEEAFSSHEVKNVFYSLDLFALDGDPDANFVNDSMPLYLYDKNPLNDVRYLWNRDVIFEDIPYLLAMSLTGYDEGSSYNWWQYKTFSREETLSHYERPEEVLAPLPEEEYAGRVDGNLAHLEELVKEHPDTDFYFFLPPYSVLWWDGMYRNGRLEEYLYARRQAAEGLLPFENVRLLDFQSDEGIVLELDNYMDPIHFSADINHLMAREAADPDSPYLITQQNREEALARMEALAQRIAAGEADAVPGE